jgi:hypothetical protein
MVRQQFDLVLFFSFCCKALTNFSSKPYHGINVFTMPIHLGHFISRIPIKNSSFPHRPPQGRQCLSSQQYDTFQLDTKRMMTVHNQSVWHSLPNFSLGCDNTPAVEWRTKGSTSTVGPTAYCWFRVPLPYPTQNVLR